MPFFLAYPRPAMLERKNAELKASLDKLQAAQSHIIKSEKMAAMEGLEQQANSIKAELEEKYRQRAELAEELNFVASEIERINKKYLKEDTLEDKTNEQRAFEQTLHAVSQKKVNSSVFQKKENYLLQSQHAKDKQSDIKKEQRKLVKKKDKDELNELFMGNLVESINALLATGVNLTGVKAPMDYKKILGGGAAEGTRGTLAYQLAVLRQINHANHCQLAPFVIDTPNQQEQAKHRYEQIMDVVTANIPNGYQVIVCAMDSDALSNYKKDAHIIELDDNRLLQHELYAQLRVEYEQVVLSNS